MPKTWNLFRPDECWVARRCDIPYLKDPFLEDHRPRWQDRDHLDWRGVAEFVDAAARGLEQFIPDDDGWARIPAGMARPARSNGTRSSAIGVAARRSARTLTQEARASVTDDTDCGPAGVRPLTRCSSYDPASSPRLEKRQAKATRWLRAKKRASYSTPSTRAALLWI